MGTDHPDGRQPPALAHPPARIFVNGHVVRVGWFTADLDPHAILLLSFTAGPWNLLVIPPETDAASAARLMAAASAGTGPPMTATALMTAERARCASPRQERTGEDGRGGAFWAHGQNQQRAAGM
nr:DUF5994 family protein [Streptomyces sp. AC550_RSS872]